MWDTVIVFAIVGLAAAYLIWRQVNRKNSGCGGGCGCGNANKPDGLGNASQGCCSGDKTTDCGCK